MARGYADVGVLRAFAKHKIPIGAIYGAEIGSLMGALYAADSNINAFEWNLVRLKDDVFTSGNGLIGKLFDGDRATRGNSQKLEEQLKTVFGKKDISQARIPLWIEVQKKAESSPSLLEKGAIAAVLRAAVARPGYFEPAPLEGQPAQAASDPQSITYLCAEARARSGGPVVLIDTSVSGNDPSAADLVIRPNLSGISPTDFSKKAEAAFRGKKAVEENLAELKRWVGIADNSNGSKEGPAQ
jgi:NTE family protein